MKIKYGLLAGVATLGVASLSISLASCTNQCPKPHYPESVVIALIEKVDNLKLKLYFNDNNKYTWVGNYGNNLTWKEIKELASKLPCYTQKETNEPNDKGEFFEWVRFGTYGRN